MIKRLFVLLATTVFIFILSPPSSASSSPIFGPNKYIRGKGKPHTYKETFNLCALGGTYKLIVENGIYTVIEDEDDDDKDKKDKDKKNKKEDKKEKKTRVSAGEIEINGKEIIEEDDFKKRLTRVERTINLPQGENQIEIEIEGKPGAYITVTIECITGCLKPKITLPLTNSTINKTKAIIKGSLYNVYGETGVIIQGTGASGQVSGLAQTQGDNFAGQIPLQQGANTITATATDACGYKATDTITITTETLQEPIRLTAIPNSGIPTLNATLEAETNIQNPISKYQWDINGDGTPEYSGTDSKGQGQYQYAGLYFPKVTITDTKGNTYEETTIVNVLSKEEMDTLLKTKWEGMKGELGQGDIGKALKYFSENSRERYSGIFTAIQDRLANIATEMREIQLIYLENGVAKYRIRRLEDAGEITYYIYYELDENGIWKVKQF